MGMSKAEEEEQARLERVGHRRSFLPSLWLWTPSSSSRGRRANGASPQRSSSSVPTRRRSVSTRSCARSGFLLRRAVERRSWNWPGGSVNYALAGVAACVRLDESGAVASIALAACGVGSVPVRLRGAEEAVIGRMPNGESLHAAAAAASSEVSPPSDIHADEGYRRRLVGTLVMRAIVEASR